MESTLSITKKELEAEVGVFAGFGRGAVYDERAWSVQQQHRITSSLKSGLRAFYFPMAGFDWSFMHPTATRTLAISTDSLDLPDDFGGIEGRVTISSADAGTFNPIRVVGEGMIREEYARAPSMTGRPQACAVRPVKAMTSLAGQRHQLYVWPLADAEYTLRLQYYFLPNALTDANPYAYGGTQHTETVISACKAAYERDFDGMGPEGPQQQYFARCLAASMAYDRKLKPQHLGYNDDRSDDPGAQGRRHWWGEGPVISIGGVEPE